MKYNHMMLISWFIVAITASNVFAQYQFVTQCPQHSQIRPVNYDVKAIVTLPPCTCPRNISQPQPNQSPRFTTQPPQGEPVGRDGLTERERRNREEAIRRMREVQRSMNP